MDTPLKKSGRLRTAGLALGMIGVGLLPSMAMAETRSYQVSWFVPAMFAHEGDCEAIEPIEEPGVSYTDSMFRRMLLKTGMSPEEVEKLKTAMEKGDRAASARYTDLLVHRGRLNGKPVNVYQNPESVPDPEIHTVVGPYALGFNLDGRGAGSAGSFEDPYTKEKGVDNQFYRVMGCIRTARVVAPERSAHWYDVYAHTAENTAPMLITLSGEDLSKDGDVTVTFSRALERTRLDAVGKIRRDMTLRMDPNPQMRAEFRGRIDSGVITVAPAPFYMAGRYFTNPFDLAGARVRLKLKPDGSLEGLLAGYEDWRRMYHAFLAATAFNREYHFGTDVAGIYYAMKKFADADPDPATGQNRRLSVTYFLEGVPAFVVPADRQLIQQAVLNKAQSQPGVNAHSSQGVDEPDSPGGKPITRRLTAEQYRHVITDVFGDSIKVSGRFEPDVRQGPVGGLAAVGAGRVSVSAMGFEQYDSTARAIAAKVMEESNRNLLMPCKPASAAAPDNECAKAFLSEAGRYLYRRTLTARELDMAVAVAENGARTVNDFYAGLELSLTGLLQSLPFLFRDEIAEPDPVRPGRYRLDAYSKASRLSFLLWNAAPDPELLAAAESGELHSREGLAKQVDRLMASPRLEAGVRAFFIDMLELAKLSGISKDGAIYPKYTAEVARDALEQTMRTVVHHLLTERGDYRDLFTTRKTFLTPLLGSVYGVPVKADGVVGELDLWQPYEYPSDDPRGGILTQVSFVSLHSHPGRTSPTLRGKALREILFCEKVPDPPANVDFARFEQTAASYNTTRERLSAHSNQPMCTGCHKITDPMGLALETFDAAGGYRTTENGVLIDTSGAFAGKKFTNAMELASAVRNYPGATSCLVEKLYAYGTGRSPEKGEGEWMAYLNKSFAEGGYRLPDLLRKITLSEAFYRAKASEATDGNTRASNTTPESRR